MESGSHDEREGALRPLRTVGGAIAALRAGTVTGEEARSAAVQVASAVEMSLRRVLRDEPQIALPVRLRALSPDELSADEVLAELRQHDRISIALAASVHDLLETRRRLKSGGPLHPADRERALEVADRVEQEVLYPRAPTAGATVPAGDETVAMHIDAEPTPARRWNRNQLAAAAAGALLLLLLIPLGLWLSSGNDDAEMEQGIVLFRSGSYADAASHFYRHAQANPDDHVSRLYLARIHRRLERYDLAATSLQEALKLAPEDAAVYTELGFLLADRGRHDEAVGRFREAIRRDPGSEQAWIGLVRVLRAAGREDAAAGVLTSAPPNVRAMLARPAAPAAPAGDSLAP